MYSIILHIYTRVLNMSFLDLEVLLKNQEKSEITRDLNNFTRSRKKKCKRIFIRAMCCVTKKKSHMHIIFPFVIISFFATTPP